MMQFSGGHQVISTGDERDSRESPAYYQEFHENISTSANQFHTDLEYVKVTTDPCRLDHPSWLAWS